MADALYERLSSPEHLRATREAFVKEIAHLSSPLCTKENAPHIIDRLEACIREIDEILDAKRT